MDFFDNVVNKTKEVFDVACKKTNEVVSTQKQKFDISSIESKLNKEYIKLGKIYYKQLKDTEINDSEIESIVYSIDEKIDKINILKKEINDAKNKIICSNCSAVVDKNSVFCNLCGSKIIGEDE